MCQSGGVNPIRSDALCIANEISDSGQGETYPLLISLCITNGMMCRKSRKSAIGGMNPPRDNPCIANGITSRKKAKIIKREGQSPPPPVTPCIADGIIIRQLLYRRRNDVQEMPKNANQRDESPRPTPSASQTE